LKLEIVQYPHPTLRHVSKNLKRVDGELRDMVAQMFEMMYEHEGVGLAGNQVDLPYRLFVTNPTGAADNKDAEQVFINPVLRAGHGQAEAEEGCLSIPGVLGQVIRNEKITVEAYDLAGEAFCGEVEGFLARIVQHEVDHLDGKLFIDRLAPGQAAELRETLEEFEIDFRSKRDCGEMPGDEVIAQRLAELEKLRA
jgi:peptide deformylase